MKYVVAILACLTFLLPALAQTPASDAERAQIEKERTPDLAKFDRLLKSADRVVVVQTADGKETKLFESTNAIDIDELRDALKVAVPDEWRAAVCAEPSIGVYKGDQRLMTVGVASGAFVKTDLWSGDVVVVDLEKWLRWFDKRGMANVRAEYDHSVAAAKQEEESERRWYAAMPRGIEAAFKAQVAKIGLPSMNDMSAFLPILEKEYPNKHDRILALLHWFGSGEGGWGSSPGYEFVAEQILLSFKTSDLVDAAGHRKLSDTEMEGAARLFAGWDFSQKRPNDIKLVSAKMRRELLAHALKSSDEDKRERAKAAFATK